MNLTPESFQRIVDNLHDGLYLVDRNRVITYWNKAAERISGFAAADVIGKSCADNVLSHVDGKGCALCTGLCPLAETMCDGRLRQSEIYLHHKNGHRIPVAVRASPKSVIHNLPCASSIRLPGLISRCTTPRAWACSSASATWMPHSATRRMEALSRGSCSVEAFTPGAVSARFSWFSDRGV